MANYPLKIRGTAVLSIAIFMGLVFAPAINANIEKITSQPHLIFEDEELVKLVVTEHKPDGTKESKIVKMPKSQVKEMQGKLRNVKDMEKRLSVYKGYGLIPQDVTSEKLRKDMEDRAKQLGLTREKIEEKTNRRLLFNNDYVEVLNYLCLASGAWLWGLPLLLGMSSVTARINSILKFVYLPSIDVLDCVFALLGGAFTIGLRGYIEGYFCPMFLLLIGFVGFIISITPLFLFLNTDFVGAAVVVYARGREWWYPWF